MDIFNHLTNMTLGILLRQEHRFGTWNIKTPTGKKKETEESKRYNLKLLGLSEVKRKLTGKELEDVHV